MKRFFKPLLVLVAFIIGYYTFLYIKEKTTDYGHKVVVCIPVYGQSYALGEEATRITDFDSLRIKYDGRIVTEHLDYVFGYYDHSSRFKQYIKRILHYDKKAFELSVYGMAEYLASNLGKDTIICIFPGGHGMNTITELMKPVEPYEKFIEEIEYAYKKAKERGWEFYVPAICWMQGESDIVEYPKTDYKKQFYKMYNDLNKDIKTITQQKDNIRIICYQSNAITKGNRYRPNYYYSEEPKTPEAQMELIRDDSLIWASGPTYPYSFVRESLHPDAISQKRIGDMAAKSALGIIRKDKPFIGLVPTKIYSEGKKIHVIFNVPCPPLCFDTISVRKADNYGFNVISKNNNDIISSIDNNKDTVTILCNESPIGCKIRYGINGEPLKNGCRVGPRGNLRDSQGEFRKINIDGKDYFQHNWCLFFETEILGCNENIISHISRI